jgi:hypothetical protein
VGSVFTPTLSKKLIKFAVRAVSTTKMLSESNKHTVCGLVQHDEAGVDSRGIFSLFELDCVGVATQPVGGLIHVDVMICLVQCPQSSNTRAAAADNGDLLPDKIIS